VAQHRNTATPQHRNTATPQHRNTATPQHRSFIVLLLLIAGSIPNLYSQFDCGTAGLSEEAEYGGFEGFYRGNCETLPSDYDLITLPVVVHILHAGGPENISDAQVHNAIDLLNQDFSGSNQRGQFTDSRIRFALGNVGPDGECTTGITRQQGNPDVLLFDDPIIINPNILSWPGNRYINIWVVRCIDSDCDPNTGIAGFATYPNFANNFHYGIVMKHNSFGNIGTAEASTAPSSLSHEMGHSFFLGHPWSFNDNIVGCLGRCHASGDDDWLFGDRVPDTYPCNKELDVNGDKFPCDPIVDKPPYTCSPQNCPNTIVSWPYPTDNIMSYSQHCQFRFTDGQICRMRQAISFFYNDLVQNASCRVANGTTGDITISTNTEWNLSSHPNGIVNVHGNLDVLPGAKLKIAQGISVQFCSTGQLNVHIGAELELLGTLTSLCGNAWQGIRVYGNSTSVQHPTLQGRIFTRDGALIENAEIGLALYGPDYSNSGGIAVCRGTTFRNNIIAVHIAPFNSLNNPGRNYLASFANCDFVTNQGYSIEDPFSVFVILTDVNTIPFRGCRFSNTRPVSFPSEYRTVSDFGTGILCNSCGISVNSECTSQTIPCSNTVRSTFTGLGYGIQAFGGFKSQQFSVRNADFSKCYFGIYSNSVRRCEVLFCNFEIGKSDIPTINQPQYGTFFENAMAGLIYQENKFRVAQTPNVSYDLRFGSFARNLLDSDANRFRKNRYEGVKWAQQFEGNNASQTQLQGLRSICNTFQQNSTSVQVTPTGILVSPNSNTARQQDLIGPTGNVFITSHTAIPDLRNDGGQNITYRHNIQVNETPSPIAGPWTLLSDNNVNTCPLEYCAPPLICNPNDGSVASLRNQYFLLNSDRNQKQTMLDQLLSSSMNVEKAIIEQELIGLNMRIDLTADAAIALLLQDTILDQSDSLIQWYRRMQNVSSSLFISSILLERSDLNGAQNELTAASLASTDQVFIADLLNLVAAMEIVGTTPIESLNTQRVQSLEARLNDLLPQSSGFIKSVLIRHGREFQISAYLPSETSERNDGHLNNLFTQESKGLTCIPNPASHQVLISIQSDLVKVDSKSLTIFDATGRVVYSDKVPNASETVQLNVSHLKTGVATAILHTDRQILASAKLIIQN
jgi:Secretion system C-terminal sorting domain/Pregnancy-associated plasma protein-A